MWSLQRILYEKKTRRFVDNMIHKYSDIRLSGTMKAIVRKRPRIEATGARVHKTNQDHDYGDQAERLSSSCCRTESERSLRWSSTLLDIEQSQLGKRHEQQQPQQDEAHLYHWRMSETRTESEYGSGISSTRLTRLLEEDENYNVSASPRASASDPVVSTPQEAEENQQDSSSLSETESSSACVESAQTSTTNQSEVPGCPTVASVVGDSSPTSSPSTTTEALLPRLRPIAPVHCVVPNCCDFFTSPHPHYPKEVIGMAKSEESLHSVIAPTDPINPDTISEGADNESGDNERGERERDDHERGEHADDSGVAQTNDEFEMWDYVCPQYARRYYANEWF